ncbi:hypothetical protein SANTM175S_09758 [Streptomyces antimycoticus]
MGTPTPPYEPGAAPADHEPAASAPGPAPLPAVPPMPTWSPMALPSPAPLPAPGGASPGHRRAVTYGLAGALFVALVAAGIPLAMSWMKGSSATTRAQHLEVVQHPEAGPHLRGQRRGRGGRRPPTEPGGTLKFISKNDADSWDPQRSYFGFVWNFSRYYARQLVTYAPKPGKDGTALVPDLAEKKAEVTDPPGHIAAQRLGLAAVGPYGRGGLRGPFAVQVGDQHPGALVGEAAGGDLPHPASRAGEHDRVALESPHRVPFLVGSWTAAAPRWRVHR